MVMMYFQVFWVTYAPIVGLCLYLLADWLKQRFGGGFAVQQQPIPHQRSAGIGDARPRASSGLQ
jgi:hypothetical protein